MSNTGNKRDNLWFVVSTSGSALSIMTAAILIIQFGQNYKKKSPTQYFLFLLSGILMLILGIYMNHIIIDFSWNNSAHYRQFVMMPIILQKINVAFLLYAMYISLKYVNTLY